MDASASAPEAVAAVQAQTLAMDNVVAAMAWAAYDYALTISDEIDCVWRRPIRSGSLLFIWVRYYGLGVLAFKVYANARNNASASNGTQLVALAELLGFGLVFSVQIILQTRIYVLYTYKRIAVLNAALFVGEIVLVLYLWGSRRPFRCYSAPQCDQVYPIFWIPSILFEAWIGALAFYKFLLRLRTPRPMDGLDILTVFLRDSVMHYALVIFGVVIFHIMGKYADSESGFLQASVFIAGSRLVLHLRAAYYRHQDEQHDPDADGGGTDSQLVFRKAGPGHVSRVLDETFWGDDSGARTVGRGRVYPMHKMGAGAGARCSVAGARCSLAPAA
ncbi:hypothetical protein AURDEDRAFT_187670 [Auricularia subglabra TFB-10046 SS5]|nr:hypothetical protein AURDEDRAFT_187670 [Auricularia subglabra TFB-10046 SS5]